MRLSNHERAAVSKTAGICRDKGGNLILKVLALLSIAAPVHCLAEAGRPAFVAANGGRGGRLAAKRSGRGRNATRQPLTSKPGTEQGIRRVVDLELFYSDALHVLRAMRVPCVGACVSGYGVTG